jgi:hypothetical protein
MSTESQQATLHLSVAGPLEGDDSMPLGLTAWVSAENDEEPVIVSVPTSMHDAPAEVNVSAGRVTIVLRSPSGRRGQMSFFLQPGELKQIEFGTAPVADLKDAGPGLEKPPADGDKPQPPMKPNGEPSHPLVIVGLPFDAFAHETDATRVDETQGGMAQTGWGGGPSGPSWGLHDPKTPSQVSANEWISPVHSIRIITSSSIETSYYVKYEVAQTNIAPQVSEFKSSSSQLEFSLPGCVAFIIEPSAPYQDKVLVHRAPWTNELLHFKIKLRNDETAIPFDSDFVLGDNNVMPLLAFIATGDMVSARAQAERFKNVAVGYLNRKFGNNHMAALGAYALLVLRQTGEFSDWMRNLYTYFDDISDGAILYAMHLIRARPGAISEWYDDARQALISAAKRPLPILTIGVHMLVEGLERLSSSQRSAGDAELARALERAQWIQARVRYDETFTALWIDRSELNQALLPLDWDKISKQ